jgi:hypothetical protein
LVKKIRRYLGSPDADRDNNFADHFVESRDLRRILSPSSDIIYGSKGVGKSALRRALSEIEKGFFFTTRSINLDPVSFAQVYEALKQLQITSRSEIANLARNLWMNVLAIFCLEAMSQAPQQKNEALAKKIIQFLNNENIRGVNANRQILGVIDRILALVAASAHENAPAGALGLTSKQRRLLGEFPYRKIIVDLLQECSAEIKPSGKVVAICLDGFDSIIDHTPEARRAIFSGLIDAIQKCSKDQRFGECFSFKAFLPQELADVARAISWDADKYVSYTHHIHWTISDFERFLARRLMVYSRTKSSDFETLWLEVFPDKVRNSAHKIDEQTFLYILRHTLYRPRQFLEHVQALLDAWDEEHDSLRIDPTFIPSIVSQTNRKLAEFTVAQLEIARSGMHAFAHTWRAQKNVCTVDSLRVKIARSFSTSSAAEVNETLDLLFNFGIVGLSKTAASTSSCSASSFIFGCVSDQLIAGAHGMFESTDVVALNPMLHEYCGSVPSEYGAIVPVSA